ncbi:MAG: 16S rRNA (adenine(1518)-N(6)/adenine(1519)-N(6))-dimethyltransferase RsmA [Planctomycetota bacterium]|jgi:16S rRNA (adenine1518-N6/adenine1519-N6)-dimethyltransferase
MTVPRTKTAVRALLAAHGFHPARMRGQHFLVDPNLVDAIVRSADVDAGDCVLEIGTGTGILTDALADRAGRLVTCDIDGRLQEITRALRPWPPSVTFLHRDILRGKHALDPEVIGRWQAEAGADLRCRVVSNLPYAVATPLLANLLWQGVEMHDAVVLVQKEAAERFTAAPGTAAYGPVSIAVHLLAEAAVLRHVGPQVFWPAPKVDSVLLRLAPRAPARARELNAAGLPGLLQEGFRWRRKTLRKAFPVARLEAAGIDPGARPQEVEPAFWEQLLSNPS